MAYTTINKGADYFNTVTYVGNGTTQSITGVGFQPDFTWIKDRTNAYGHDLYDVIRGATNRIQSNDTGAESSASGLTSFDSDGFSLGSYIGDNSNTANYASWNWLAGGTASSNTDGTITSSVSANTTSGFSIVSWTGDENAASTVGHGLGSDLGMIIIKNRIDAEHWQVWHKNLTSTSDYRLLLSSTIAQNNNTAFFSEAPTSSFFTPGSNGAINGSGDSMIAYCFAEKKGFSKFGSYTGNGSADGTFVYTGMRPSFIMIKRTDTADVWHMIDNKRNTYNTVDKVLFANQSSAEATSGSNQVDFLSNGFKTRGSGTQVNASGGSYIYMAFAEHPFVSSAGTPATAR